MAKEQYIDLLEQILEENIDDDWGRIEPDGDGYNDWVFIWDLGSKEISKFNELCKAKLKANDIDTYPDYDYDSYYIDFITGDNWGYYDSYYVCDGCNKAYRLPEYGMQDYWVTNYGIYCSDCVKEDLIDDYIDNYLVDEPTHANTILDVDMIQNKGFEKANEDGYENGWYGTTDDPREIYQNLKRVYPNSDVLFDITSSNPFAVYFDVYIRKADEDIKRDRYINKRTGNVMSYEEMKKYCEENYDYGDETNAVTYMKEWYREYGYEQIV